jgi:hypothetical protein
MRYITLIKECKTEIKEIDLMINTGLHSHTVKIDP